MERFRLTLRSKRIPGSASVSAFLGLLLVPNAERVHGQNEYSERYAEVKVLHEAGQLEEALHRFPGIYEMEVPVDSFYATLERKRDEILADLVEKGTFRVGDREFRCDELRRLHVATHLSRPDVLRHRGIVEDAATFSFERYLYLLVVAGTPPTVPTENSLLETVAPRVDLASALRSRDPWVVSAALYLDGRQADSSLGAQAVIDRWQERPDLWDERCSREARRLLARLSPEEVAKLRTEEDSEARGVIETLEAVPSDKAEVRLRFFDAQNGDGLEREQSPRRVTLRFLERMKRPPGQVVRRFAGDPEGGWMTVEKETREIELPAFPGGVLELPPGACQVKCVGDTIHGESVVFDAVEGCLVVVPVGVRFGI